MIAVFYVGRTDGLTGTAISVITEIKVEYTGYFTDRVNSYPS